MKIMIKLTKDNGNTRYPSLTQVIDVPQNLCPHDIDHVPALLSEQTQTILNDLSNKKVVDHKP